MKIKPRSQQFFLAALALIALHVIDDSFLQPQPGTSAADHLVGGLVPLVLAALSGRAFIRARPGARAVFASAWSLAALVSGVEAVYYSQHGGLNGDDYSGLGALAMTPLLLGLAVAALWRSRKMDGHPARRAARRLAKGV